MANPVALSPEARAKALARMGEGELDVLVVGGGVVGCGAALDALRPRRRHPIGGHSENAH